VDIFLGPVLNSTGEVMGIDETFSVAYAKGQIAAGNSLPRHGRVFVSLAGKHKYSFIPSAKRLKELGFKIACTSGTARVLREAGIEVELVKKLQEGRPNLLDLMANDEIQFIFNTPSGKGARTDEGKIRAAAVMNGVPYVTTLPGCHAVVQALEAMIHNPTPRVRPLQDWARQSAELVAR
jgi:carbamoyl-phosphate synthase large subunit